MPVHSTSTLFHSRRRFIISNAFLNDAERCAAMENLAGTQTQTCQGIRWRPFATLSARANKRGAPGGRLSSLAINNPIEGAATDSTTY